MKIRCSNCNAAYAVDDAKVDGKKFGFECPKCGESVVIDNRRTAAPQKIMPAPAAEELQSAAFDMESGEPAFSGGFSLAGEEEALPGADETESSESFLSDEFSLAGDEAALPSMDGGLPEIPSLEENTAAESEALDYDTFEDEIEPEIDLSVLSGASAAVSEPEEEDILSADLSGTLPEEELSAETASGVETISPVSSAEDEDESITIDLDSLDIDLSEPEDVSGGALPEADFSPVPGMDGLDLSEPSIERTASAFSAAEAEDEDESITLDLDSLDIDLEESDAIQPGESIEDESRLSLNDAGLTLDDVPAEQEADAGEADIDEDEFHLSLDEVGADIDLDEINDFVEDESSAFASEEPAGLEMIADAYTADLLPEVDLEKFGSVQGGDSTDFETVPSVPVEDRFLDIEGKKEFDRYAEDIRAYASDATAASGGGYVNFSVDYSFHYSRLKALLRLLGIFYVLFIPHIFVCGIYAMIAAITGTVNWLLVLFSGKRERDFSMVQEQSLRYALSIIASMLNVTEDLPPFAGKKNVDYQMQYNIVYPPEPSKVLAFCRLSVIGILVLALPHLILLTVLTVGMGLIAFVSLIYTVIMGRWPSITFDFMVRYLRYKANISAYVFGLIDTYPSFRFE
ncbi:MAG: DUF4389 domain-containing protein [Spirochaetota bacterium]